MNPYTADLSRLHENLLTTRGLATKSKQPESGA